MKKLFTIVLSIALLSTLLLGMTGCGNSSSGGGKNIEGSTEELLQKIYDGVDKSITLPFVMNIPLSENMGASGGSGIEYYLGSKGIPFKEGIASEAAIGGAYSVCLIRLNSGADVEKVKNDIKSKVNPNKWICYTADTVIVDSKGDLVILIMTNEKNMPGTGKAIHESFKKLS